MKDPRNPEERYAYWLMANGYDFYAVAYYIGSDGRFVVTGNYGPLDVLDTYQHEVEDWEFDRRAGYENHWLTQEQDAFTTVDGFPVLGVSRAIVTVDIAVNFPTAIPVANTKDVITKVLGKVLEDWEWQVTNITAPPREKEKA